MNVSRKKEEESVSEKAGASFKGTGSLHTTVRGSSCAGGRFSVDLKMVKRKKESDTNKRMHLLVNKPHYISLRSDQRSGRCIAGHQYGGSCLAGSINVVRH